MRVSTENAIRTERRLDGEVLLITIDRPERRNAFDGAMAQAARSKRTDIV